MKLYMASAFCSLLLAPLCIFAAENPTDDAVIHGTINIAFGNKNGLVVLTDSMVTATDPTTGDTRQLPNPGQKLFKLDDRTVCAVAGFAAAPAVSPRLTASDLNTSTSAIIHEYVRQSALQPRQSIVEKLRTLAFLFEMHLAMIANVRDAAGNPTPINAYRFQLIVAGFDMDDKPKIGRIALRMRNDKGSLISEIEDVSLLKVEEELVVQLAGMPDVAAQILQNPESKPQDPAIKLYATSRNANSGRSMTLEQMVELAKRLAYYSSNAHQEVGGPNQVAILRDSKTVTIDQPTFPEPPRSLLRFSLIVGSQFRNSSVAFAKGNPAVFVRCLWAGMQHDLDGHYYIGNEFTNSVLMYDGGAVNFGDTNRISDSVLLLGPHAILENKVVQRLTASFPSLRVAYAGPKLKPWQVVP